MGTVDFDPVAHAVELRVLDAHDAVIGIVEPDAVAAIARNHAEINIGNGKRSIELVIAEFLSAVAGEPLIETQVPQHAR